jgi:hypothetical protein
MDDVERLIEAFRARAMWSVLCKLDAFERRWPKRQRIVAVRCCVVQRDRYLAVVRLAQGPEYCRATPAE